MPKLTKADSTCSNPCSPDDFVVYSVLKWPALFAAPNLEDIQLNVYDHVFNTIGSGVYLKSFYVSVTQEDKERFKDFFTDSVSDGYVALKKATLPSERTYESYPSTPDVVIPTREKHLHPDITVWLDIPTDNKFYPYANFDKQYSFVWDQDFKKLGKEWTEAAIWYYEKCKKFFNSVEDCAIYNDAFPCHTEGETNRVLQVYKKIFEVYKTNDEISEYFEIEFTGDKTNEQDIYNLLVLTWDKERARILAFIEETLVRLKKGKKN